MDKKQTGIAIGVLVAVGAAYVAASAFVGSRIEARLKQESAAATRLLGGGFEPVYDRGVLGSTRALSLPFGCGADGKPVATFVWRDRIRHGPLPGLRRFAAATIDSEFAVEPGPGAGNGAAGPARLVATVHTVVGFDGDFHGTIASPAREETVPDGTMRFGGVSGDMTRSGSAWKVDLTLPLLAVESGGDASGVRVEGVRWHSEGNGLDLATLLGGKSHAEIDRIEFKLPAKEDGSAAPAARFTGLKVVGDSRFEGELMSATSTLSGTGEIGSVKIEAVEMQASIRRFHLGSYGKMLAQTFAAATTCAGAAEAESAAAAQAQQAALVAMLGALLPHDPEYSLDHLKLRIDGREGRLAYSVGAKGIAAADLGQGPAAWLPKIVLKADAAIPVAWVERFAAGGAAGGDAAAAPAGAGAAFVDSLQQQGLVQRKGDEITATLEMSGGQLSVNGRPMALPAPPVDGDAPR